MRWLAQRRALMSIALVVVLFSVHVPAEVRHDRRDQRRSQEMLAGIRIVRWPLMHKAGKYLKSNWVGLTVLLFAMAVLTVAPTGVPTGVAVPIGVVGAAIQSNGTGGGDWSAGASWNGGVAPGDGDDATILSGDDIHIDSDITVGPDAEADAILIKEGGTVTHDPGNTLYLKGRITIERDAIYTGTGTAGNPCTIHMKTDVDYMVRASNTGSGLNRKFELTGVAGTNSVITADAGIVNNLFSLAPVGATITLDYVTVGIEDGYAVIYAGNNRLYCNMSNLTFDHKPSYFYFRNYNTTAGVHWDLSDFSVTVTNYFVFRGFDQGDWAGTWDNIHVTRDTDTTYAMMYWTRVQTNASLVVTDSSFTDTTGYAGGIFYIYPYLSSSGPTSFVCGYEQWYNCTFTGASTTRFLIFDNYASYGGTKTFYGCTYNGSQLSPSDFTFGAGQLTTRIWLASKVEPTINDTGGSPVSGVDVMGITGVLDGDGVPYNTCAGQTGAAGTPPVPASDYDNMYLIYVEIDEAGGTTYWSTVANPAEIVIAKDGYNQYSPDAGMTWYDMGTPITDVMDDNYTTTIQIRYSAGGGGRHQYLGASVLGGSTR